jgi:peptidoglycan/xylan/chitin deacetylase (PgdA/CDA1 family)
MGMEPVLWSVTSFDWKARSAQYIVNKITRAVASRQGRQSEIVLLHDGGHLGFGADRGLTVEATRVLLNQYAGMQFVTVTDLKR